MGWQKLETPFHLLVDYLKLWFAF